MMKDPLNRTKVVIRNLPPSLSQYSFFEQIDGPFAGRYNWSSFHPGLNSHKHQRYARAYMNFNSPEDVFVFAEFFNGHVFVNEKGAQFKAIVEYSPSQRVPRPNNKKDGREGTIFKDPEYVEFLERISKPVENLPSADVQLERREVERGVQEAPIVTPLMEYVRKRRAGKIGNQATAAEVKERGRVIAASPSKSQPSTTKQVSEKKKYILKNSGKSTNLKDKPAYILVTRRDDQLNTSSGKGLAETESGSSSTHTGKKKILLLKGKGQEISQNKAATSPLENSSVSTALKLNARHDASGRVIRSILLNKETRQSQSSSSIQSEQKLQNINSEKDKRLPRPANVRSGASACTSTNEQAPVNSDSVGKRSGDDKSGGDDQHGVLIIREKQDKRIRNKDRLDRGVWTPLCRTDALNAGDEHISQPLQILPSSREVNGGDTKNDMHQNNRGGEIAAPAGGQNSCFIENGSHNRHFARRGTTHNKDDGLQIEGKSLKRGSAAGHTLHEKQVWIQKSASGS